MLFLLPNELLFHIGHYLSYIDFCRLQCVNRDFGYMFIPDNGIERKKNELQWNMKQDELQIVLWESFIDHPNIKQGKEFVLESMYVSLFNSKKIVITQYNHNDLNATTMTMKIANSIVGNKFYISRGDETSSYVITCNKTVRAIRTYKDNVTTSYESLYIKIHEGKKSIIQRYTNVDHSRENMATLNVPTINSIDSIVLTDSKEVMLKSIIYHEYKIINQTLLNSYMHSLCYDGIEYKTVSHCSVLSDLYMRYTDNTHNLIIYLTMDNKIKSIAFFANDESKLTSNCLPLIFTHNETDTHIGIDIKYWNGECYSNDTIYCEKIFSFHTNL